MNRYRRALGATVALLAGGSSLFGIAWSAPAAGAATVIQVDVTADTTGVAGQCSLRDAVAAANAHATVAGCVGGPGSQSIALPAGTYDVTGGMAVTEPVTIIGANTGVDGRGSRGPGSTIDFHATPAATILFQLFGAGGASTFDGLDLRGQLDPTDINGQVNAIIFEGGSPGPSYTLENSTVGGFTWALYGSGDGMTVRNNDFLGDLAGVGDPNAIGAYGNAIYGDFGASNMTVVDNRFAGYANGAFVYDTGSLTSMAANFDIERNTILDDGALGILVGTVDGATIAHNWITASPTNGGVRGIVVADGSSHVSITDNTIDSQTTDPDPAGGNLASAIRIRAYIDPAPLNSTITIHGNRIAGNSTAVYISPGTVSDTVDATGNWWGANGGIGALGGSGRSANGVNVVLGVSAPLDTSSPLQLAVDCTSPTGYQIGSAGPFTAQVPDMPTWFTAAGDYDPTWPQASRATDPLFVATAAGASITSFTGIVSGSGAEVYGGTVTGTLTPNATTGNIAVGVDEELLSCAWTASAAATTTTTTTTTTAPTTTTTQPIEPSAVTSTAVSTTTTTTSSLTAATEPTGPDSSPPGFGASPDVLAATGTSPSGLVTAALANAIAGAALVGAARRHRRHGRRRPTGRPRPY
jgi:CSLREA domain-containing protein